MSDTHTDGSIATRLWFYTWLVFSAVLLAMMVWQGGVNDLAFLIPVSMFSFIGSSPALVLLMSCFRWVLHAIHGLLQKFLSLLFIQLLISGLYGCLVYFISGSDASDGLKNGFFSTLVLFGCNVMAVLLNLKSLKIHFAGSKFLLSETIYIKPDEEHLFNLLLNQNVTQMEQHSLQGMETGLHAAKASNKILTKGAVTGALILIMLIPTVFITNLVQEREQRQKQVVAEVSNKWAKAQTITGPYIIVPYNERYTDSANHQAIKRKSVVLLPEMLQVNGNVVPQQSHRSIYQVLLYKSNIRTSGNFSVKLPQGVVPENMLFNEARLCVGLSDFKGIEGMTAVSFNGAAYDLTPGLPSHEIDLNGLSALVPLTADDFKKEIPFSFQLSVRGSGQLSFVPLAGNSRFTLQSSWPSPSFDGNTLPSERKVHEKGFTATWNFSKANLPYSTAAKDFTVDKAAYSFGVTMLQPADQYVKTLRSVKYALLFIGLTFSLFFIAELMQKKPVHPVQYVLIGLALVIFYSLLLSISEYVMFDYAYLIAATATVALITLYAKGHFLTWKVAAVFGGMLTALYTFTFVLISLEDTALLVGSIGLFAVLALVMYASRKINWYHPALTHAAVETP